MVIDLCQVNYQILLITYLEFIIKNANNAWKKKLECEFIGFKNGRLNYKCKECGNKYTKSKNEAIINFPIMHQFCNGDLNKFFLLLRKGVCHYEYMDSCKKI